MSLATITLDTHRVVKHLLLKGYSEDQAEGFIDAIREINLAGVATKQDIDAHRAETKASEIALRAEMKEIESSLRSEMKAIEFSQREEISKLRVEIKSERAELYKFMMIQALGIVGLTVTLVKLLPQF